MELLYAEKGVFPENWFRPGQTLLTPGVEIGDQIYHEMREEMHLIANSWNTCHIGTCHVRQGTLASPPLTPHVGPRAIYKATCRPNTCPKTLLR